MLEKVNRLPTTVEFLHDVVFFSPPDTLWLSSGTVGAYRRQPLPLNEPIGIAPANKFLQILPTLEDANFSINQQLTIETAYSKLRFHLAPYQSTFEPPKDEPQLSLPATQVYQFLSTHKLPNIAPTLWGENIPGVWDFGDRIYAVDFGFFLYGKRENTPALETPIFIPTRIVNLFQPGIDSLKVYEEQVMLSATTFALYWQKVVADWQLVEPLLVEPEPQAEITLTLTKQAIKRISVLATNSVSLVTRRNSLWVVAPNIEEEIGFTTQPLPTLTLDLRNLKLWWEVSSEHKIAKHQDTWYLLGKAFDGSRLVLQTLLREEN